MSSASIMSKAPITIREQDSVSVAAATLVSHHLSSLPVLDAQERYVGTFGIHDLFGLLVPRVAIAGDLVSNLRFIANDPDELRRRFQEVSSRPIGDFANRNAPTLEPDSPEAEAIRLFCRNHDSLPIVDGKSGRVLGTLSCWDAVCGILDVR